jgi:hypothetical protein
MCYNKTGPLSLLPFISWTFSLYTLIASILFAGYFFYGNIFLEYLYITKR